MISSTLNIFLGGAQSETSNLDTAPLGLSYCGNLANATGRHTNMAGQGLVLAVNRNDGLRGYQSVICATGIFARFYNGSGYDTWVVLASV